MELKNGVNLDILKKHFDFLTHPEDGIKSVKIVMMRLKSYNGECDISLKIPRNCSRNIYEIIAQQVDHSSSIVNSLVVKEVWLDVESCYPDCDVKGNLSFIKIHSSGKCELKNSSEKNNLIINKYLKSWGLENGCCN